MERSRQIDEVLDAALACEPADRAAVLDACCGDNIELRREVERYLDHLGAVEGFLAAPPAALAARYVAEAQEIAGGHRYIGRRIGNYRLVRQIGRGGMSRVFLAERADGQFAQQVAIKLLRPGFDSDVDVERFRDERQILATLSHPHIARLHDGGVTHEGLPYLVLEYVEGEPIDVYCAARGLSARARLELLLHVADAVQYAHDRSIVHRDLKPSNILVSAGEGSVKLLDFGLARMLEAGVTGEAPPTRTGHRWMTPEYAAPEQIRDSGMTPRTDVYQLGAVLYELLSGHTPFGDRIGTLYELELAALTEEPTPLGGACRGDVDAIILKALSKRPEERYATAGELAADLRRHLAGHPVVARRRTPIYRARRFARRHRSQLVAAALGALVVGVSVTTLAAERRRAGRVAGRAAIVQTMELAGRGRVERGELEAGFALLQRALVMRRGEADGAAGRGASPSASARPVPSPAHAPTQRGMLFTRPGDVFLMHPDGTHETRITHSPESWNDHAAWASDGMHILLSRAVGGDRAIFVTSVDGSEMVQLTAPPPGWKDEVPVPLDDGVAFVRTSPAGHADIYDVAADGSTISRLTTEGRVHDPAPVPGSQLLAYVSDGDIRVLNRHTGERRRLTNSPTQYKAGLAVSPDGTQIAFTRIDPGRLEQIFVMDLDGTHVRRVSRGDFYDFLPRWSPDGTRLAFTSLRDGTSGVYTMRVDGRDVVDVSRTPASLAMRPGVSVLHVTETLWAWR